MKKSAEVKKEKKDPIYVGHVACGTCAAQKSIPATSKVDGEWQAAAWAATHRALHRAQREVR